MAQAAGLAGAAGPLLGGQESPSIFDQMAGLNQGMQQMGMTPDMGTDAQSGQYLQNPDIFAQMMNQPMRAGMLDLF